MVVIAHGAVEEYCRKQGLAITDYYCGDLEEFNAENVTVVTDELLSKNEFYYLKYRMLRNNTELLSTRWDITELNEFVVYLNERCKSNYRGRPPFGFVVRDGVFLEHPERMELARRILRLRDNGKTYREIMIEINNEISIGTVLAIVKNRSRYE